MKLSKLFLLLSVILCVNACNNSTEPAATESKKVSMIKEENITYTADSVTMNGFVAYDSSITGKRPAVLIVHEWWGLNDYTKRRARELAALGYIAIAVDMYGNGKNAANPDEAGKMATPFYQNPQMAKARFDAALEKIKTYQQTDTTKIGAMGYCFGGAIVLNMARMGDPLTAVVSFHGNLAGVPANKDLLKSKILVCHGADDQFVKPEEVTSFKKQMDSIKADYIFKSYPGATHAFTNPDATALGQKFKIPIAYNAAADTASWNDMKDFFGKILK
ncbi:MAG: dienelactone hydrolase family protein [Ferruginibacter sp.]